MTHSTGQPPTPRTPAPQTPIPETPTAQEFLALPDGPLAVRRDGPRDAPALLLVHGTASSGSSWDALVPLLAPHHHVVRVDLPGHGRSPEPTAGGYGIPAQGRRVAQALDALSVPHAVVVGHSSGGYTATALAEQRPDLVTALALVDTGPALDAFLAQDTATAPDPGRWPPTDAQVRQLAATGFRAGYTVPQYLVDEVRAMSLTAFTAAARAGTAYLAERPLPPRLAALGKPLHVVFGAQDRRWRPSSAQDYLTVPGATLDLLPDAGHTPILEDPPETAACLLPFTAYVTGGGRTAG
ncbi:alpha/beta fold hydrolase [Actinacidiphila epipremni]|uniref:Alpha/beta fold hydrolase n=1 Tax=Actinacidiphila epipremni TaxID=2053013 RepID=A0ABX1A049_9ACTN|nr:alpha/beta fold hydrolase [Actinacidiphila epipremni]NJP48382.1 alpha/beta fold hydrolase [Actinacidiphila epipremni]